MHWGSRREREVPHSFLWAPVQKAAGRASCVLAGCNPAGGVGRVSGWRRGSSLRGFSRGDGRELGPVIGDIVPGMELCMLEGGSGC